MKAKLFQKRVKKNQITILPTVELNPSNSMKILGKLYCRHTIWRVAKLLSDTKRAVILNKEHHENYPILSFISLEKISDEELKIKS